MPTMRGMLRKVTSIALSLIWLGAGVLLTHWGVEALSPLGADTLATATWVLLFAGLLASAWVVILWFQLRSYQKHYPSHQEELMAEKYFNEFADKN